MGKGQMVYFDDEAVEIIKKMKRGELSQTCSSAVKEFGGFYNNLEAIEKKLEVNRQVVDEKQNQNDFLKEQIKRLKTKIKEDTIEKKKIEGIRERWSKEEEEERKRKLFEAHVSSATNNFNIDDKTAIELTKKYSRYGPNSPERQMGWAGWIESQGYERK